MTQNNEHEVITKLALECGLLLKTTNLDLCPSYLTKLESFAKAYKAQNEQKEAVSEWLEIEISAIDTRYRGSPSYDHDAYWFKNEVLEFISKNRSVIDNFNTPHKKIPDRWISVEDRLPTIGSKVWVGRYGKVPAAMEAIFDGDSFVDPEQYGWTYASKFKDPTHWQPEYIPSPPTNIHKGGLIKHDK